MKSKQIENLIEAYKQCEEKEQKIGQFLSMSEDCFFLADVKENIFLTLIEDIPEDLHAKAYRSMMDNNIDVLRSLMEQ